MKGYLLMNPREITEKVTTKAGKTFDSINWVGQTPKGFEKKVPSNYVLKIVGQEDGYSKVFLKELGADELAKKSSYVQDLYKYASKLEEEPKSIDDPNLYTVDQNVFDSIEVESAIKQDKKEAKEKAFVSSYLKGNKIADEAAEMAPKTPIIKDIPNAVFDSAVVQELEKKIAALEERVRLLSIDNNLVISLRNEFLKFQEQADLRIHNNLSNIAILEKKLQEQDEVIRDLAFQKNTLNLGQDTMDFLWKIVERMYTFRSCEDKKEGV
jgi:hypothetical protein